jgi:uncharacterized membrane protein
MLHLGTWAGSCIIAAGWATAGIGETASLTTAAFAIVEAGIALFILLPVLRVLLMLAVFVRERDYRFGGIAALVLTIIIVSSVLGFRMTGEPP